MRLRRPNALLAFIGVYGYQTACAMTPSEMVPALQRIWAEVLALGEKDALELSMQPQPQQAGPLWNRLLGAAGVGPRLRVAFLHERTAENLGLDLCARDGPRRGAARVP